MNKALGTALVASAVALAGCSHTAPATTLAPAASVSPPTGGGPLLPRGGAEQVVVSFAGGGSRLTPEAEAQLDVAARTYRDGHPLVMYVAGFTDRLGSEYVNLIVAAQRAEAVKAGLVARGIPADRLQTAALGEADPAISTSPGVPEPTNRRVIITWK